MINNLLIAPWLRWTFGILLALLILLAMITIHEFGHYLAGKILKFKINEFSIGFGPAIFKRKNKKTGELFAIRIFPLGGYCSFEGEDGLDEESENGHTMSEEPPPQASKEGVFTEKKPWQRIIVLVAGAFMNYVLALLLILTLFAGYGQSFVQVRGASVTDEFPAEYSFQEGDILLEANGRSLYLTTDIAQALKGKQAGDIVKFRVARKNGDGGYTKTMQEIMLRADVVVKNSTQVSGVWKSLGIGIEELDGGSYYMLSTTTYRFGFFETIGRSFVYSFKIMASIFQVLGDLFTGNLGINALGGPVTTITMTSQIATSGFQNFLEISAYIGVNLAFFNLLPLPALDGSKVVFTAIEWIRGKPINRKVEAIIHLVGIVLLFAFAITVDILQFVL